MLCQPTDIACTEHQTTTTLSRIFLVGHGHESISSPSFWSHSSLHLPAVKLSTNRHQSCTFSLLVASKHGLLSQNQGKSIVQKSEAEVERISSRSSPNLQTLLSFPLTRLVRPRSPVHGQKDGGRAAFFFLARLVVYEAHILPTDRPGSRWPNPDCLA